MRAVLLLPGPSLASVKSPPPANVLIGVKRAAVAYPCDWACILDIPCLLAITPTGSPRLLTRAAYRPKYSPIGGLDVEALAGWCPLRHDEFTSTAALVLAGFLGAERVEAYGADFGEGPTMAEFDGFVSPEANYSPERWARERKAWDSVADWLRGRGVEVERMWDF